jgi:aldose 1-epimerase
VQIHERTLGYVEGKKVVEYIMTNDNGIKISCLNYGCAVTGIVTPDRRGIYENIVLGFKDLADYQANPIFAGVVVGRVAGRIRGAQFQLGENVYTVAANDGPNHIHGGLRGFHKQVWNIDRIDKRDEASIRFSYVSLDGEEGYPGTLTMTVTYTLTNQNEFTISYQGQADKTTLFNPSNHTYFNLSGNLKRDIGQHRLRVDSSRFLEVAEDLLPTGRILNVNDSVFDFRTGQKLMEGIQSNHFQNQIVGNGYDHAFLLNSHNNREIILADEESGRSLIVETDAVGVVLYTGNNIPDNIRFANGIKSKRYLGLCLETQGLPDAIHHANFPSYILEKGQTASTRTKYTFVCHNLTGC